jgi:hypothetical protein
MLEYVRIDRSPVRFRPRRWIIEPSAEKQRYHDQGQGNAPFHGISLPATGQARLRRFFKVWQGSHRGAMVSCWLVATACVFANLTAEAQPDILTLTMSSGGDQPISILMMLKLANRTVRGIGLPGLIDYPLRITTVDDKKIAFSGTEEFFAHNLQHGRYRGS